ncbi:MAG: DUF2142 domain-containing protein [Clostridiales bacterium]|nr:DUF2142 domain-containing protein [Clostridiales bacterium]
MEKKSVLVKYKLAIPIIVLVGILITVLAYMMDENAGPDEILRIKVVNWIVENNRLPTGFEEELIDPIWGFSYAFTPYLPLMFASLIVKVASWFTLSVHTLLFAARLVNVLVGMGTVFVAFRVADKLMDNKYSVYFFVSLVACLPQFIFLAGYLNNDAMSLLTGFMILDAVLEGARDKWNNKNMVYLSVGIALCMLTYYFGYGWILFAIVGYFYTSFKSSGDRKTIFKKAGMIVLLVFILAGWYFIRNAIIYKGDFLGYTAQKLCAEAYSLKHGTMIVNNPGRNTMHLRDMLYRGGWIELTLQSFIGMFGGMVICLDGKFYDLYCLAFLGSVFFFVLYRHKTRRKLEPVLLTMLLFEIVFPIFFSIYSSYTRDFSPQGRYVISILPSLCVLAAMGIDELSKAVTEKFTGIIWASKLGKLIPVIAALFLVAVFVIIFYTVMLPTLTFTILPGSDKVSFYYVR